MLKIIALARFGYQMIIISQLGTTRALSAPMEFDCKIVCGLHFTPGPQAAVRSLCVILTRTGLQIISRNFV